MRVAVVGSREFRQTHLVHTHLNQILKDGGPFVVVSGGAEGVDKAAEDWAYANNCEAKVYPADWETLGDKAGPARNAQIVADSDRMVAFWDGESPGTLDAITRGKRKKGYDVLVILGT